MCEEEKRKSQKTCVIWISLLTVLTTAEHALVSVHNAALDLLSPVVVWTQVSEE